jgi:hypothetical protein
MHSVMVVEENTDSLVSLKVDRTLIKVQIVVFWVVTA